MKKPVRLIPAPRQQDNCEVNRNWSVRQARNKRWFIASATLLTILTIGIGKTSAQTPVNNGNHRIKTDDIKSEAILRESNVRKVTGVVTDESGEPLVDVLVSIPGTERKVMTDINGIYTVYVKKGDILLFDYVGMRDMRLTVSDSTKYNVTMREYYEMGIVVYATGKLRLGVASEFMLLF